MCRENIGHAHNHLGYRYAASAIITTILYPAILVSWELGFWSGLPDNLLMQEESREAALIDG
jgi:hypothetical protein